MCIYLLSVGILIYSFYNCLPVRSSDGNSQYTSLHPRSELLKYISKIYSTKDDLGA